MESTETDDRTLGEILRDGRGNRFTLRTLATQLRVSPSYICDIENERRVPAEDVLENLAKVLDLDFDWLMAKAGRLGEQTERFMKRNPEAIVLMRRMARNPKMLRDVMELVGARRANGKHQSR